MLVQYSPSGKSAGPARLLHSPSPAFPLSPPFSASYTLTLSLSTSPHPFPPPYLSTTTHIHLPTFSLLPLYLSTTTHIHLPTFSLLPLYLFTLPSSVSPSPFSLSTFPQPLTFTFYSHPRLFLSDAPQSAGQRPTEYPTDPRRQSKTTSCLSTGPRPLSPLLAMVT